MTINGPGVTIDGGNSTRLFFVNSGSGQAVTINGLTLANGNAQGGNGGDGADGGGGGGLGAGGAVFAQSGNLTLTDVSLIDNQATGGNGGVGLGATGAGGGGGGLGGNGGAGLNAGASGLTVAGGGGGGGITEEGTVGVVGNNLTGQPGMGGGSEGGDGGDNVPLVLPGNGGFGGGGAGGTGATDGASNNDIFDGADGGFGGGGGGGASTAANDEFQNGDGGNGGFGAGGGGGGAAIEFGFGDTQGGAGGLGAGNGGDSVTGGDDFAGGGSGGGGAGLGGAIFLTDGATLTITQTASTTTSGNSITAGIGGAQGGMFGNPPGQAGADGQSAGALLFAQGANQNLTFNVADGVTQSLDLSGIADETQLTDSNGAAGAGTANLIKEGLGDLALAGSSAFAGSITVNQGGIGGQAGAVGTLTLDNNLTINSGGELNVEFDATTVDQINVGGTANIAGTLNFIELTEGVATDTPHAFLTASTLNGTFDDVNTVFLNGSSLVGADVTYTSTQAFVTFSGFMANFGATGLTSSGSGAGRIIDTLATTSPTEVIEVINALNSSTNVAAALESQGNTISNASASAAFSSFTQVTNIARTRVNGLGSTLGGGTFSLAANTSLPADQLVGAESLVSQVAYFAPAPVQTAQSIAWAQVIGGFNRIDGDAQSLGIDAQSIGIAIGAEASEYDNGLALLGIFFGYTDTDTNVGGIADASEATNLQVGFYGKRQLSEHWATNGTVSFSYLDFDTQRPTALGVASGDFGGFAFQGTAELLRHFHRRERFVISPLVGLELSVVHREAYTEAGAGALNLIVDDETNEFLNTLIGVQAASNFTTHNDHGGGFHLYTASRFAWGYQHLDDTASTTSNFTAPGSVFTSFGPRRNRGAFRAAFNLELAPVHNHDLSLFTQYTIDVTSDASDQIIQGGVRLRF